MKKSILIIAIVLITFAVLFCGEKDDPQHFQKLLGEMVHTANLKDIDGFMEFFSINYKDDYDVNYLVIKNTAEKHFRLFDSFEVVYEDVEVLVSENSDGEKIADVSFDLIVTGVKNGVLQKEIIGQSGHLDYVSLTFKKSGFNKWKIVRIEGLDDKVY